MTPDQMLSACDTILDSYRSMGLPEGHAHISLVTPAGFKWPAKFPRSRLLIVKPDGERVWHAPAFRVRAWLLSQLAS